MRPGGADMRASNSGPGKMWAVRIQHSGPCVLPWLWESVAHGDDVILIPQPIDLTAGPEGEMMVWKIIVLITRIVMVMTSLITLINHDQR